MLAPITTARSPTRFMVMLLSLASADTVGNGAGLQCEEPHGHKNVRRGLKPQIRISVGACQMHWALSFCLSMIFSENRFTLFGIMPLPALPGELKT
jgi:hypothetical protein